jgi:hypothetical protein
MRLTEPSLPRRAFLAPDLACMNLRVLYARPLRGHLALASLGPLELIVVVVVVVDGDGDGDDLHGTPWLR